MERKEEEKPQSGMFRFHGRGFLSGKFDEWVTLDELRDQFGESPIIEAWLADPDVMLITLASANIGYVYTFEKPYSGWTLPK